MGNVPAEDPENECDFEVLQTHIVEREHLPQEEYIQSCERNQRFSVDEWKVAGWAFVEVDLGGDVVDGKVEFLLRGEHRLLIGVNAVLLMQLQQREKILRVGSKFLGELDPLEADVALDDVPRSGAKTGRGQKVGIELGMRGVRPYG